MASEWYYTTNRQQMGPVSWEELQQLAERGLLKPQDLVWTDGMPEWVKASRQQGLFATAKAPAPTAPAPAASPPAAAQPASAPAEADDYALAPEPEPQRPRRVSRKRADDDDDDVDDEDEEEEVVRRRRRRRVKQDEGMAVGLKIGLAIAGGIFLLAVLGCGGFYLLFSGGSGGPVSYSCSVAPKRGHDRWVYLKKGKQVVITVTSTSPNPQNDVDLHVYRNRNDEKPLAWDESIGPNSRVVFFPPEDASYKLQVRNLGNVTARAQVNVDPREP
jgi:hypothetical protein